MPKGIYSHKPNQGFQKGHKVIVPLEARKRQGLKISGINNPAKRLKVRLKISATLKKLWQEGKVIVPSQKGKVKARGENSHLWKGEDAKYQAKHKWIREHWGTPNTCDYCRKSNLKGQKINWANKSKKYLRDKKDWIRLCRFCHSYYDNGSLVL